MHDPRIRRAPYNIVTSCGGPNELNNEPRITMIVVSVTNEGAIMIVECDEKITGANM
jgi:hypothetical protein